ncbi:MAG TPA: hypothetical protein VK978_00005, partial [Candidatus Saccharimonadales bacterium]|nr:hypothetical protein [Candidatus Saccharimonadales bacterium]
MRSDVSLNAFSALPPHIAEGILMGQEANRVQDPVSGVRQFRGFEECNARIARQIDHAEILRANAPLDSSSRKVIEEIAERIPAIEETTGLTGWNLNRAKLIVQAIGVAACRPEGSEAAAGIVLEGRLHGHPLPPTGRPKHSVDALKQSTQLLKIYRHDPEAAGTMAERQVIGFHGTRSGTLPSILKYGLLSGRDARSHPQIAVHSGERMWSPPNGQPGVHFAQWRTPKTIAAYTKEEPPITIPSLEARRDAMVEFAAEYRTLFG